MKSHNYYLYSFLILIMCSNYINAQSKATPPPISSLNFHSGSGNLKNTLIYFGVGNNVFAYGDAFQYTRSLSDHNGFNLTLFGMNMAYKIPLFNFELDDNNYHTYEIWTEWSSFLIWSIGGNFIQEIIGGEKKDIAGEIIENKFSLSLFGGGNVLGMSSFGVFGHIQGGLVFEIPLGYMFSIVPYASYSYFMGDENSTSPTFGWDLIITPFRNSRDWKISLGASLALIENNKDDNMMFTIGIIYEWGKYYKGTTITPH